MNEEELEQKRVKDGEIFYKEMIRQERDELLKNTDKYMIPDYPISEDKLTIIKTYRQELRDIPTNNFIIPNKPDFIK